MRLARIDVAAALAERAAEGRWCLPQFVAGHELHIEGGRHPVVESALAALGERFIANDCDLAPDKRLWLVSGPNMGGKSTFLRQNALIVILAQAGSYVPADLGAPWPCGPVVQPCRRIGQSGARALNLHGRNGRNRRDHGAGDASSLS